MKKHQEAILQSLQAFDERVMKLFQLKINCEKTVLQARFRTLISNTIIMFLQEELKIQRLSVALLVEEEVKIKENELENVLNENKSAKVLIRFIITY